MTTDRLLAHNVFFALHDHSPEARQRLLDACRQYLAPHPGIVSFACGSRAAELQREVNDLNFDVGLHIVFTDQAAHDSYQGTAAHHQFIAENKANWRKVRVFDSLVASSTPTAS
jgi:stress responsive alpha/beta barrel protein